MKEYILAIDQGTTSTRAILFHKTSKIESIAQMEFTQITPKNGWVEHDPEEIWETVYQVVQDAVKKSRIEFSDIAAIGITNQRETTVVWDKLTGKPIYNAIVWQSRQSQKICEDIIEAGHTKLIQDKTGLIINPYFSASKIRFILDQVPGAKEKARNGELLFGTIDTYLVWKLTRGALHITDASNASRTMLYNIHTLEWDQTLLDLFEVPKEMLPEVQSTSKNYGIATALKDIDSSLEIPIAAIVGDQQASLFGQCCFEAGDTKNTYGTGCFMLMNTATSPISSKHGLLTTIAWNINGKVEYALEGSVFVGGSAIQWLRDGLRMFEKSSDCEAYATRIINSGGVYVVPAFVGLGTPYWDNDARGAVFGITRSTQKEHLITATLESIAFQSKDVMEVMKEESNIPIRTLSVDGGACKNDYLMQFQSNLLDCKIVRQTCFETTALGAAYLAGLAVGVWKNKQEIKRFRTIDQIFTSKMKEEERVRLYKEWKMAVNATRMFKP